MNRLSGFKYRYPQEFLDELAKKCGVVWTPTPAKLVPRELIEIRPMGPPSSIIYCQEIKYEKDSNN